MGSSYEGVMEMIREQRENFKKLVDRIDSLDRGCDEQKSLIKEALSEYKPDYPYNFKYISLSDYHNILNDKPEGYVEPEWFGGVSW